MQGRLGGILALLGLSASLMSCALILGEGGEFDNQGTSSISTTSSSTSSSMSSSTISGGGNGCPPGSVDVLADDFSDATHTFGLWSKSGAGSADVANGALLLNGPIELFSKKPYSIIGCQISFFLGGLSGSGAPPEVHFNLANSAGETVAQISVDGGLGGDISFKPANPIKNCPFDQSKHSFWRFRATSSELFIETSSSGLENEWTDEPCDAANGEGKFSLSQLGLTNGQVQVHLGTSSGQAALEDINE